MTLITNTEKLGDGPLDDLHLLLLEEHLQTVWHSRSACCDADGEHKPCQRLAASAET